MNKVFGSAKEALAGVLKDNVMIGVGGFGLCGIPEALIQGVKDHGAKNLTVVSNNCGIDGWGLGIILENKQLKKVICSYIGGNAEFERQFIAKEIEVELTPQGTLAEKLRSGGCGIPAFYTKTGVGTLIEEGKETKTFDGQTYLLEQTLTPDLGLVKAWKADRSGNLVYRLTARNFNPMVAMAAKLTVVEVEEIVENGQLDPDQIHTPGIFVHRIVLNPNPEKRIEQRTVRPG
ncbi:MAG: CoA transferase subunit A [Burkholderiales bacterium]|jgi:3-oxoacid CoA-transferase subunit A|nr:CoA transferase subunit A [Polynucleobacter sp.]MCX7254971.1 CoA transferase subunit A [Burkholderiales bacterium]